jgi:hypothetical protein
MRAVDLAVFADALAAQAATLAARLERARDELRQAALEREARRALPPETVERLEHLGALRVPELRGRREEIGALAADLAAVEELQAWVEARLFAAREETTASEGAPALRVYRGASATRSPPSSS